jgi:hypothetical protein
MQGLSRLTGLRDSAVIPSYIVNSANMGETIVL